MAESTFDAVKQTSRTFLFEEFDSSRNDSLFDVLNIFEDPTSDGCKKELEKLEVHSYEEFLKNFQPKVYEIVVKNVGDSSIHVRYTTDASDAKRNNGREKNIIDHPFYRMLQQMYVDKGDSGLSNLDFDDKELLDMLKPDQEVEDAKDIRKKLARAYEKYLELNSKGENTDEYVDVVRRCREKIAKKYKDSLVDLLPIAIDDVKSKIRLIKPQKKNIQNAVTEEELNLLTGRLVFDENGELDVEPISDGQNSGNGVLSLPTGNKPCLLGNECRNGVVALLEKDYSKLGDNNRYVGEILVNTFAPPANVDDSGEGVIKYDLEKLNKQKDGFERVYAEAKESFIEAVKDVCEKLLSVKIFFDHATTNGEFKSGLLVTNCKTAKLLQQPVRDKFERLIKHEGNQTKTKVWFAIIPGISDSYGLAGKKYGMDDELDGGSTVAENDSVEGGALTFNKLKSLLKILGQNKIVSFFSLKGSIETGFGAFNEKQLNDMKDKFGDFVSEYSQYAVLSFPNFNIVRDRKVGVTDNSSISRVHVPGIFVDACYVAAGLQAGSQQIDYLISKGYDKNILQENVCVRINLEDVNTKLLTRFNLENSKTWISDLREMLDKDKFGFVFCSDTIRENGHDIKNAYVYSARTLGKKDGIYRPIYRVLTEIFLNVYFQTKANKNEKTIKEIIEVDAHNWLKESQRPDNKECVNLILKEGDKIYFDENDKKVHISYVADPKRISIISVEGN